MTPPAKLLVESLFEEAWLALGVHLVPFFDPGYWH
jgi:hypothetical protein